MKFEQLTQIQSHQQYIATMRPLFNRRALFTDTTAEYISPAEPANYDVVTIRFRTARNNVDRVFLVCRGERHLMNKVESTDNFDFYASKRLHQFFSKFLQAIVKKHFQLYLKKHLAGKK